MVRHLIVFAVAIEVCWLAGCSRPKGPKLEPTFPVSGVVQIDGKPTAAVHVFLFPADSAPMGFDPRLGSPHSATTDADGKFKITTYNTGDGAPAGSYVLGFYWEGTPKVVPFSNPDEPKLDPVAVRFNRKYGNPQKSEFKATVERKSVDLGKLELTTK
jgi:5-hydroxyisourate hydrolase-like protein (transthyretin family)